TKEALKPIIILIATMAVIRLSNEGYPLTGSDYNILVYLGTMLVGFLPFFLGTAKDDKGPDDLAWLRHDRLRPADFEKITKGGATVNPPREILVIRGIDDEAGFALTAGSLGSRISSIGVEASMLVLRIISWTCIPVFLLIAALNLFVSGKIVLEDYVYPA